jgi:hypothetical protein
MDGTDQYSTDHSLLERHHQQSKFNVHSELAVETTCKFVITPPLMCVRLTWHVNNVQVQLDAMAFMRVARFRETETLY